MTLPIVLDIAISLVMVYLILSLLVSQVQELIATVLQWRAKSLKAAIEFMLGSTTSHHRGSLPATQTNSSNLSDFSPNPATLSATDPEIGLLNSSNSLNLSNSSIDQGIQLANTLYQHPLIQSLNHTTLGRLTHSRASGPSYIPSETFATVLMDILKVDEQFDHFLDTDQDDKAISDVIQSLHPSLLPASLKERLISLARRAQRKGHSLRDGKLAFQYEIQTWFDRCMDRASGVYTRNTQGATLLIGLIISIALNVDTLRLVDQFSRDSTLRDTISQSGNQLIQICTSQPSVENPLTCTSDNVNTALKNYLPLPIGWQTIEKSPRNVWEWLYKILGWLLTGIAISMGSSFWFNILSKLINVRNTGPRPHSG